MPYDINSQQVDIENLFKQNVNDLASIKELYRKLKELEEKITQIKYIDSKLADKLKKDYESLKRVILNENIQIQLSNRIDETKTTLINNIDKLNSQLDSEIYNIKLNLNNNVNELITQINDKASKDDVAKISNGTPLFASNTTEMTDITKNYVNTTDGYLYIYSGGSWVKTTVKYQSTGIAEGSVGTREISKSLGKVLGVRVVDFTTVGGYINNNHAFVSNGGFNTTSPIYLQEGEEIYFKTNGIANNMYVLSITNSESTVYRDGILCTTSGLKEYTYTAKEDCYIVISGASKSISVDNIVTLTDNIKKVEEKVNKNTATINTLINKKNVFIVGNSETADYIVKGVADEGLTTDLFPLRTNIK